MSRSTGALPDFQEIRGKRILIALSGGADSVALTHMLHMKREALGLTLLAAHMDHGIRPESPEDADFCRRLCRDYDIEFFTCRVDIPGEAQRSGEGIETAARRIRHTWLNALADEHAIDHIALAHHMDDQAETVLMRLARGTGPEGMCGMTRFSGRLYRPLLGMRKAQLLQYDRQNGLSWREDVTNALDDNPRNAIRLHALGPLEQSYPGTVEAIARFAQTLRCESDYLAEQTRHFMQSRLLEGPYGRRLDLSGDVHPALLRRAVHALCGQSADFATVNALCDMCSSPRGAVTVSGGIRCEKCGEHLYFCHGDAPAMRQAPLSLNGTTRLDGICQIVASETAPVPIRDDPFEQVLDADALSGAVVRTRRPGDRFRPLGCGDRLLSDFFTDRKHDRPLRDWTALVARDDRVLWVCGLGISQDARLKETSRAVRLECRYAFDMQSAMIK